MVDRLVLSKRLCFAVVCMQVFVGMAYFTFVQHIDTDQLVSELRNAKQQRLSAIRTKRILDDHPDTIVRIESTNITQDKLVLNIVEALQQFTERNNIKINQLSVQDAQELEAETSLTTLRVQIGVVVPKAAMMLEIFDVIKTAAAWFPIEIRGCDLDRQTALKVLTATCAIDVLYFSERSV